jgi:hypothetical protein
MNKADWYQGKHEKLSSARIFVACLILGCMLLLLSACGQKAPSPDSAPKGQAAQRAAEKAPLPPAGPVLAEFKCDLSAKQVPREMKAGSKSTKIQVEVTNKSTATWYAFLSGRSVLHAVNIAYRWWQDGKQVIEGGRALLSADLNSGESARVELAIKAPDTPGDYVLRVELVQEGVHWFSEVGGCKAEYKVRIVP